jgi:hypothetical protein
VFLEGAKDEACGIDEKQFNELLTTSIRSAHEFWSWEAISLMRPDCIFHETNLSQNNNNLRLVSTMNGVFNYDNEAKSRLGATLFRSRSISSSSLAALSAEADDTGFSRIRSCSTGNDMSLSSRANRL